MHDKNTEKIPFRGLGRTRQVNGSYCGPAVLQTLLSHFGVMVSQEQLVDAANCRSTVMERGMPMESLAEAIHRAVPGMSFWMKRGATIADLEKITGEYRFPVAVDWQGILS